MRKDKGISLKRFLIVIISLFCTLTIFAAKYASPYMGSGRNYLHLTSGAYSACGTDLAQAPVASMSSTSRGFGSHGSSNPIASQTAAVQVHGIYTAASAVRGGVTTAYGSASAPHKGGPRRSHVYPGGYESDCECPWIFDEENGTFTCPICGCVVDVFDIEAHHHFHCDCDSSCHCPLTISWDVWMFMAVLVAAYAVYKNKSAKGIALRDK